MNKILMVTRSIVLISLFILSCGRSQEQDVQNMNERTAVPVEVVKVELNILRRVRRNRRNEQSTGWLRGAAPKGGSEHGGQECQPD